MPTERRGASCAGFAALVPVLVLVLVPLAIILMVTYTDIDLRLADAMYDAGRGQFPWRHAWVAEVLNHVLLKRLLVALACAIVAFTAWDAWRPWGLTPLRRWQWRIVAASAILIPACIALLKQASSSHCPWDLERYGGSAPYIRLLDALPAGVAPGHCLPAGHASSALWLIAFAVFFMPARPRMASAVFVLMLAFSFAVGWLQQLRGAHFLSHTLWSVWIACAALFALVRCTAGVVKPRSPMPFPPRSASPPAQTGK